MLKITDPKLGTRLFLGFGLVLLCASLLLVLSLWRMSDLNRNGEEIVTNKVRSLSNSLQMRETAGAVALSMHKIVIPTDAFEEAREKKLQENQLDAYVKFEQELQRLASNPQSRTILAETIASRQAVVLGIQKINSLIVKGNYFDASFSLKTHFVGLHEKWMASLFKLADHHQAELRASYVASLSDYRQTTFGLLAVGLLTLAIGAAISISITRTSTRPLQYSPHIDDNIASGDFIESIEQGSSDEAGRLVNSLSTMRRNSVRIVNHIKLRTEDIYTASREIASRSADLSPRTKCQAGPPQDTASSTEELTSTVKHDTKKRKSTLTANQDCEEFLRLRSTGIGVGAYCLSGASADISIRRFFTKDNAAYLTVLWHGLIGSADAENDAEWGSRRGLRTCWRHTQILSFCRRLAGDGGAANADGYAMGFTPTFLGASSSLASR